ncbi:MAG: urease accessory protein UreD [Roseibium sp.]|uniref:urease accessory protein UreD n=1 Tax=Roseibium sp. TaxID=1936156 RepID=UPI0026149FD9|nr:urease accessory protein UreD [Roseibium sp.]MCV0425514.1 urease accessory protein UreD [Roseibium sp.]
MYDAEAASGLSPHAKHMQRVKGTARIRFALSAGKTRLADLYQNGSAKIRLPKVYNEPATAVLINTAGGLTGGDELSYQATADEGTHAIVTSQAAERAYRSPGGSAKVTGHLAVGAGATLEWLPQETILFEASDLKRQIYADLAGDARLLMLESIVLGRKAMGEQVQSVSFKDSWRIRRDNKLVFADDIRFQGDPSRFLHGPATAGKGQVVATFVDCAIDAEDRLSVARSSLDTVQTETTRAAASTWNGLLVARLVSTDSRNLRSALMHFLTCYRAADLPRVWHC